MAFKIRTEYWNLSEIGDGLGIAVLKEAMADAVEYDASTEEAAPLPISANRAAYAMSVTGLDGAATVEVGAAPTEDAARGRLVTEGTIHWFIIEPDSLIYVEEYAL